MSVFPTFPLCQPAPFFPAPHLRLVREKEPPVSDPTPIRPDIQIGEETSPTYDAQPTPRHEPYVKVSPAVLFNATLSPWARLVYFALQSHKGDRGIFPRQDVLAAELGTSTDTVQRALKDLQHAGLIRWIRQGRGHANRYELVSLDTADDAAPTRYQTHDAADDAAPVRQPETAPMRYPETAPVRHRTRVKEQDPIELGGSPLSPPEGEQPTEPTGPKQTRKKNATPFPADFALTDERREWAIGRGLTAPQAGIAFDRFKSHAESVDRRQVDWDASWRTWVLGDIQRGVFQGVRGRASPFGKDIGLSNDELMQIARGER